MSKPSRNTVLCFPGEMEREFWSCNPEGVWKKEAHATSGVMGIESILFDSAPFWTAGIDESQDTAVALRWEALGLSAEGDSRSWMHWPVTKQDQRLLVGTVGFSPEAGEPMLSSFHGEDFEPSALMLPLPANGIAIWTELGRHIVALTRGTELLHLSALASRQLDADAALEIRDLFAALQVHGFAQDVSSIRVWTHCETDFVPQLACVFTEASVLKEPRPDPRLPKRRSHLLPASVAQRRRGDRQKQRQMMLLAALALVFLSFFGAWWGRLAWRDSRVEQAEAKLEAMQPQIAQVREAQSRWLDLEAALNPDLYPVELFHQIVTLLPEKGVRLREFQVDDTRLIIKGEATSVNHALGFRDRLASSAALSRYDWTVPVPAIREDNRAEFTAEGKSNGEAPHESQ
jgi:type II secretory pathway component PulM